LVKVRRLLHTTHFDVLGALGRSAACEAVPLRIMRKGSLCSCSAQPWTRMESDTKKTWDIRSKKGTKEERYKAREGGGRIAGMPDKLIGTTKISGVQPQQQKVKHEAEAKSKGT
jgi:hypothetical protein